MMDKGFFPLTSGKSGLLHRAALAGLLTGMITVAGCATYPGLSGLTGQGAAYDAGLEPAAAPADPERASAAADIHAKAKAVQAGNDNDGSYPNVFYSYGPARAPVMTRADRLAVEAELDAVLAAQAQVSDPAEAEQLKARAAYLRRLARQHAVQAESEIEAASQAAK
jgi:hypothetical protein